MQIFELEKLGNRIKTLRKERNLTLSSFCYKNNLEPSTVSRIEKAEVEAKYITLLKIAKGFDMEISKLLDF